MAIAETHRKLSAILCADVEGFSRLMGADEVGTHRTLIEYRALIEDAVARHGGRIVGTAGDGVLADFGSAVEALGAALEMQAGIAERNVALPEERRVTFRVGVNLGDVIVDGDDLFGDGVNVAARIQAIAPAGGVVVSSSVHEQVLGKLDCGFHDLGKRHLKNIAQPVHVWSVHRQGERAPIRGRLLRRSRLAIAAAAIAVIALAGLALVATGADTALRRLVMADGGGIETADTRPVVAVLPFANQTGSEADAYFGEGIADDLVAALGRFPDLFVLSRNAVFDEEGRVRPVSAIRRDLGVRYVVEGSVRRSGERVRVTARLTDAETSSVVWSERFDENLDDIFAVQDAIVSGVAGALVSSLTRAELDRIGEKPTDDLRAYDLVLRGRHLMRNQTREANIEARRLFERAMALDPDYARAHTELAATEIDAAMYGWTEWPLAALASARGHLQTAIQLDGAAAEPHALLAIVHHWTGRDDLQQAEIERALSLNPNHPAVHALRGIALNSSGRAEEAASHLETALRYDPVGRPSWRSELALARYLAGDLEEAVEVAERCAGVYAEHAPCYIVLAAASAMTDRSDDARKAVEAVRRTAPFFDVDEYVTRFRDPDHRGILAEGLRRAGL